MHLTQFFFLISDLYDCVFKRLKSKQTLAYRNSLLNNYHMSDKKKVTLLLLHLSVH